ncbi:MAG: TetR/AcrR family transcriptional regulator [Solimonas sp.]
MKAIEPPRKLPRQARAQATVEAILEAAARILAGEGYAAMSTNRVAERAGVSVGSLYQYFPNKNALVAALHQRHGRQIHELLAQALDETRGRSLREQMSAMVHAGLQGHLLEPELHRVLEHEFPFFDTPASETEDYLGVHARFDEILEAHRDEIAPRNLKLARYMIVASTQALVHAAVIDPPAEFDTAEIEAAIVDLVMGYLNGSPMPLSVPPPAAAAHRASA